MNHSPVTRMSVDEELFLRGRPFKSEELEFHECNYECDCPIDEPQLPFEPSPGQCATAGSVKPGFVYWFGRSEK